MTPKWPATLRHLNERGPGVPSSISISLTGHSTAKKLQETLQFLADVGAITWVPGTWTASVTQFGARFTLES